MTDLQNPASAAATRAYDLPSVSDSRVEPHRGVEARPFEPAASWRVLLAALSAGAGVIHLAMVPSHWTESPIEGFGFAVSGWFQLAIAALIIGRPRRGWLRMGVVLNLTFIAVWAVSRRWGLPIGAHAGQPEQVSGVDLTCVGFEAALVVGCLWALARPRLGAAWSQGTLVVASVIPVSVVLATTAVLASPSVHDHAQQGHGDLASSLTTDGHDHSHEPAAGSTVVPSLDAGAAAADGHSHGGKPGTNADQQAELQPDVPLDKATQKQLGEQLAAARDAALKYPTVRDAKAAGMIPAGGVGPGFGAHFMFMRAQAVNADGTVNAASPNSFIYEGVDDDSPVVGLMYTAMTGSAPEGFAGPNDHWHRHSNVCLANTPAGIAFPTDSDVTKEQCDEAGGRFMQTTISMVHAWVVPGWESPKGVFSHDNPNIHCPDGTDNTDKVGACVVQQLPAA